MTTRRNLFTHAIGATAAMAVFTAGTQLPIDPDAILLALIAESNALIARIDAMLDGVNDYHLPCWGEAETLGDQAYDLKECAAGIGAKTLGGLRAKAEIVLADLECTGIASEMAKSLARDVMAGRAVA